MVRRKLLFTITLFSLSLNSVFSQPPPDLNPDEVGLGVEEIESQNIIDSIYNVDNISQYTQIDSCTFNIGSIENYVVKYRNGATALLEIDQSYHGKSLSIFETNGQSNSLKLTLNVDTSKYIQLKGLGLNKRYIIKSEDNCNNVIEVAYLNTKINDTADLIMSKAKP